MTSPLLLRPLNIGATRLLPSGCCSSNPPPTRGHYAG
jgi:hypothetical protein